MPKLRYTPPALRNVTLPLNFAKKNLGGVPRSGEGVSDCEKKRIEFCSIR